MTFKALSIAALLLAGAWASAEANTQEFVLSGDAADGQPGYYQANDASAGQSSDAASVQYSVIASAQNVALTGTMGDGASVTDPALGAGEGVVPTVDPRVSLPDGIGFVITPEVDFSPLTALATPKAALTGMLFGFASLGFAAYRRTRRTSVAIAA